MPLVEGIFPEMSSREYFAKRDEMVLTNSGIKTLLNETPADFIGKEWEDSHAKRLGDVTHQLALGKGKGYIISPYDEYRTNEAKAWRDKAIADGITPIKLKDFEAAAAMASIISKRVDALLDGEPYETEVPFFWTENVDGTEVWCSGMMDIWCPSLGVVIDPKVTPYVHGDKARVHIANMGWHTQNAWYRRGLDKLVPSWAGRLRFLNLLISPKVPHTSRAIQISEGWRTGAEMDCDRALTTFGTCIRENHWPGYDVSEILDEPTWMTSARVMREMEDEE